MRNSFAPPNMTPDQCLTLSRWEETLSLELKRMPLLCEEGNTLVDWQKKGRSMTAPSSAHSSFRTDCSGTCQRSPVTSVENCAALQSIRVRCVLTRFPRHAACYSTRKSLWKGCLYECKSRVMGWRRSSI